MRRLTRPLRHMTGTDVMAALFAGGLVLMSLGAVMACSRIALGA